MKIKKISVQLLNSSWAADNLHFQLRFDGLFSEFIQNKNTSRTLLEWFVAVLRIYSNCHKLFEHNKLHTTQYCSYIRILCDFLLQLQHVKLGYMLLLLLLLLLFVFFFFFFFFF
jgi:hypothetical protein